MTPIEFVIPQRPVSQQARRQARLREWKDFVGLTACCRSRRSSIRKPLRLNKAHERGPIPLENAREVFLAVDAIVGRWLDAVTPWPPR